MGRSETVSEDNGSNTDGCGSNMPVLGGQSLERLTKQQKRAIIEERGSETILEKGDGLFLAIRLRVIRTENSEQRGMPGLMDLTSLFEATVMPSCLQQASRAKY